MCKTPLKKLADFNENKILLVTVLIVCILIITPLLVLGIYNRPSADDYSYAIQTHQAVRNGDGLFAILKAALKTDIFFYSQWQGLYSSAFLLSLHPGIWGESFYAATTVILMLFMFFCLWISINIINKHYLRYSKLFSITAAMFLLMFFVLWLPSPTQGLYWFNGAANYVPWAFLNLLNACLLVEANKSNRKIKRILLIIISVIFSFLTSGGNHVTAFADILILFFLLLYMWIKNKRIFPIFPFLAACIGFLIMYKAPGTAIRQSAFARSSVKDTIANSAKQFFVVTDYWISLAFILTLFLMIPIAIRFSKQTPTERKIKFPWQFILASIIIICGMLSVPFYSMGFFGEGRLTNVIWITFIMLGWMNYFLIFRWAYCNRIFNLSPDILLENKFFRSLPVKCFLIIGIIISIALLPQRGSYSGSRRAFEELMSGVPKAYAAELDERFAKLNDDSLSDVTVTEIQVKSELLFFDDVGPDETDWRNTSMSQYYGKNTIKKAVETDDQ